MRVSILGISRCNLTSATGPCYRDALYERRVYVRTGKKSRRRNRVFSCPGIKRKLVERHRGRTEKFLQEARTASIVLSYLVLGRIFSVAVAGGCHFSRRRISRSVPISVAPTEISPASAETVIGPSRNSLPERETYQSFFITPGSVFLIYVTHAKAASRHRSRSSRALGISPGVNNGSLSRD